MLWSWGLGFIICDILIAAAMLLLLCSKERAVPRAIEWFFPVKGRWLWYLLLSVTIAAYVALAPVFLYFLVVMKR
jgi:hypothetical protein